MNKYQIAKQEAYKLIVKEAKSNLNSVNLIPKFAKGIVQLEEITNKIDAIRIEQEKDLKGITIDKDYTMDKLEDYLLDVAGAVHSYAQDMNNHDLMSKVNYKASVLEKMSQADLINAAKITMSEAEKIAPEDLANEGISAEELKEYKDLYIYFSDTKSATREAIIDRSGSTEKLLDLFKQASILVKGSLDRLATQFKRKDPDFYLKYKAARNIVYSRPQKDKVSETGHGEGNGNKLV